MDEYSFEEFDQVEVKAENDELRKQLSTFKQALTSSLTSESKRKRRPMVAPFETAVEKKQIVLARKKVALYARENKILQERLVALSQDELSAKNKQLEEKVAQLTEEVKCLQAIQRNQARALVTPRTEENMENQLRAAVEQRRRAEAERAACQKNETELRAKVLALSRRQPLPELTHHENSSSSTHHLELQQQQEQVKALQIALERAQDRLGRVTSECKRKEEEAKAEVKRMEDVVRQRERDFRLQQSAINKLKTNLLKLNERYIKIKDATAAVPNAQASKALQALRRPTPPAATDHHSQRPLVRRRRKLRAS